MSGIGPARAVLERHDCCDCPRRLTDLESGALEMRSIAACLVATVTILTGCLTGCSSSVDPTVTAPPPAEVIDTEADPLRIPDTCPEVQSGVARADVAPFVGVWRLTRPEAAPEVPLLGVRTAPVWGIEIQPSGHFHALLEGTDGGPVRQAGFDSEGALEIYEATPNSEGWTGAWLKFGTGSLPFSVRLSTAGELEAQQYAYGNAGFERFQGEVRCAKAVPPRGSRLGKAGCASPENYISTVRGTEAETLAQLTGKWATCKIESDGRDITSTSRKGLEITATGELYDLVEDADGGFVRGPLVGTLRFRPTDDGTQIDF